MERKRYLDVAKGIALILVIWGHAGMSIPGLGTAIIQFHMPLFFVVSGYLFKNTHERMKDRIVKKAKRLLVPYFIFSVVYLSLGVIKGFLLHQGVNVVELISLLFYLNGNVVRMGTPMWFLPVLFFTDIIYTLIKKYESKYAIIICVVLAVAAFEWMPILPFGLRISCIGLLFFMLGDCSKGLVNCFEGNRLLSIAVGTILLVFEFVSAQYNPGVNLYRYSFGVSWVRYILLAVIGAFGLIFMGGGIESNKILEWISKQSLFILSTHFIILMLIDTIFNKLGVEWVNGAFITALCLLVEALVIMGINKIQMLECFRSKLGVM